MKNKERLGNIPKGLEWLTNSQDQNTIPTEPDENISTSEQGLNEGWTRATFIITKEHLEKIKDFAWWERVTIKEVMHEALIQFLKDKEIVPRKKRKII